VWENRKTYGTIGGMGTNKVRWVNFFQGASNAVEPKDIYTGVSSWPYQRVFASLVRRAGGGATYRSRDPITPSCWIVLRFFMRFLLLPIKKRLALRAKAAKDPPELARCSLLLSSSSNTTRAGPQRLFNPEALQCLLKAEKPSLALTPQDQQDLHDVLRALEVKNFVEVRSWVWAYIPEAIKGRRHGGDDGGFLGRTQRLKMAKVLREISKRMGVDEGTAASVMRKSPDLYAAAAKKAKLPTAGCTLSLMATITLKAVLGLSWSAMKILTKLFISEGMANPLAAQKQVNDFVEKDDVKSGSVHTLDLLCGRKGSPQTTESVVFAWRNHQSLRCSTQGLRHLSFGVLEKHLGWDALLKAFGKA
jgi:hypothetical protein